MEDDFEVKYFMKKLHEGQNDPKKLQQLLEELDYRDPQLIEHIKKGWPTEKVSEFLFSNKLNEQGFYNIYTPNPEELRNILLKQKFVQQNGFFNPKVVYGCPAPNQNRNEQSENKAFTFQFGNQNNLPSLEERIVENSKLASSIIVQQSLEKVVKNIQQEQEEDPLDSIKAFSPTTYKQQSPTSGMNTTSYKWKNGDQTTSPLPYRQYDSSPNILKLNRIQELESTYGGGSGVEEKSISPLKTDNFSIELQSIDKQSDGGSYYSKPTNFSREMVQKKKDETEKSSSYDHRYYTGLQYYQYP